MRIKLLLAVAILLLIINIAKPCNLCGGGTSDLIILSLDGRALINLGFSYDNYLGVWDQSGTWKQTNFTKTQIRYSLSGAYRVNKHLQFGLSIPFYVNHNAVPGLKQNSSGIGDINISGRYEFFHEFEMKKKDNKEQIDKILPYLALTFGITLPTGKSEETAENDVDVIGKGFYTTSLGVSLTKTIIKNKFQVSTDLSWQHSFKKTYDKYFGVPQSSPFIKQPGDKYYYGLTFNYIFSNWHAVSFSVTGYSQNAYFINSQEGVNSSEHGLNFMLMYTYYPSVPIRISPSIKWTIPTDNLGKNATGSTTFVLNFVYYFPDYDLK